MRMNVPVGNLRNTSNARNWNRLFNPLSYFDNQRFNITRANGRNWKCPPPQPPPLLQEVPHLSSSMHIWDVRVLLNRLDPRITKHIRFGHRSKFMRCPLCGKYDLCDARSTLLRCIECTNPSVMVERSHWREIRHDALAEMEVRRAKKKRAARREQVPR